MTRWVNKNQGFTVVELLIVIVVIAILAAITVVAFNGIQMRAQTSKVVSSADAVIKALEMYKLDNGAYPLSGSEYYCIGREENYPPVDAFGSGSCMSFSGNINMARVNTAFNNLIQKYISSIPDGSITPTIESDTYGERGLYYHANSFQPNNAYLYYRLPGDIACPKGQKRNWYLGMTACEIKLGP